MIRPFPSLLGLLLALASISPAYACTCDKPPPPPIAFEEADAVFSGTTVSVQPDGSGHVYAEIAVSDVWKGDIASTVMVRTSDSEATCGYDFVVGQADLIYARVFSYGLWTGLCTRTRRLSEAGEDLKWLGDGTPVATDPELSAQPPALSVFPNPFLRTATVQLTSSGSECAALHAYNLSGRLVRSIPRAACGAGRHTIEVNFDEVPAGVYVLEVQAKRSVVRRMMTLIH